MILVPRVKSRYKHHQIGGHGWLQKSEDMNGCRSNDQSHLFIFQNEVAARVPPCQACCLGSTSSGTSLIPLFISYYYIFDHVHKYGVIVAVVCLGG